MTNDVITDNIDIKIIPLYKQGLSDAEIGKEVNLSGRTIEKRLQRLRKQGLIEYRTNLPLINQNGKKIMSDKFTYDYYTQHIEYLKSYLNKIQVLTPTVQHYKKDSQADSLIINFTDWHIGRLVKDERGVIVYNEKIFKERIDSLLQEILKLLDLYISRGTPIDEVVILSTGDLLDGQGIFPTQETVTEFAPPFQVELGINTIVSFIRAILKRKLPVKFYGVKGNHGEIRMNGKSRDPNANWDLMLYLMLNFWVNENKLTNKVSVKYSELDFLNLIIKGQKYLIRHIAPAQLEGTAGKARLLAWGDMHDYDALVFGHLHHWLAGDINGKTVFRGGCVSGIDEHCESGGYITTPCQLIWGCNAKRPMTFLYAVDLGKGKKNISWV